MTTLNTEEMNALGQWWATHSNDHAGLIDLLQAKGLTLADFCHATGQHEASLGEWLLQNGAPAGVGGYNPLDPKWDAYFRRAVAAPVANAPTDGRFSIGGQV